MFVSQLLRFPSLNASQLPPVLISENTPSKYIINYYIHSHYTAFKQCHKSNVFGIFMTKSLNFAILYQYNFFDNSNGSVFYAKGYDEAIKKFIFLS